MLLPFVLLALVLQYSNALQPRQIVVDGKFFVRQGTNDTVLLQGTNIVMKGYPWLPPTHGIDEDRVCADHWYTNFTCYTFSEADAIHISMDSSSVQT